MMGYVISIIGNTICEIIGVGRDGEKARDNWVTGTDRYQKKKIGY